MRNEPICRTCHRETEIYEGKERCSGGCELYPVQCPCEPIDMVVVILELPGDVTQPVAPWKGGR